jgi:hypothetical protein
LPAHEDRTIIRAHYPVIALYFFFQKSRVWNSLGKSETQILESLFFYRLAFATKIIYSGASGQTLQSKHSTLSRLNNIFFGQVIHTICNAFA